MRSSGTYFHGRLIMTDPLDIPDFLLREPNKPNGGKPIVLEPVWESRLDDWAATGEWDEQTLGPPPGCDGCRAPPDIVARYVLPAGQPTYGPNGPSDIYGAAPSLEAKKLVDKAQTDLDDVVQDRDAQAVINKLAELSDLTYQRRRIQSAQDLKLPVAALDKMVRGRRDELEAESPPLLYPHWEVEPWDKQVEGAALLYELAARIRRHVIISEHQAVAIALWVLLTWVHEQAAVHSPILLATSAEANSGKSTLLGVIGFLVRRSLLSISITGPALFRSIERWQPTFAIDEADTSLVNNEDLREVVNSGWTRGQAAVRCDPETNEPRPYSTFCPKAIGMKGRKLPDTTLSRAIIIEMKRKLPGEVAQDFDHIDDDALAMLRRKALRWANDNAEALAKATPVMPDEFQNRVRANWKLLVAIAEKAGGDWPERVLRAAKELEGVKTTFDSSIGVQLLADIRAAFAARGTDRLSTKNLIDLLAEDEERPWATYCKGDRKLAGLLGKYGVISDTIRIGDRTIKGYMLAHFADAFGRYLDPTGGDRQEGPQNVTTEQRSNDGHNLHQSGPEQPSQLGPVTEQPVTEHPGPVTEHPGPVTGEKPPSHKACCAVTSLTPSQRSPLEGACAYCGYDYGQLLLVGDAGRTVRLHRSCLDLWQRERGKL
jgi:putative DNA primase/helicase